MESFKHVSNTWLLAQLIHPVVFYLYAFVLDWTWMETEYIPAVFVFGFVFSICGYLLCFLSFHLLYWIHLSVKWSFIFWGGIMSLCIAGRVLFTSVVFFDYYFFLEIEPLLIPAIIAAIISACLRYRQFVSTLGFSNQDLLTT